MRLFRKQEKRKFPRINKTISLKFRPSDDRSERKSGNRQYKAEIRNIGGGGLCIEANLADTLLQEFLTMNPRKVVLNFSIPETMISVIGTAEIAWVGTQGDKQRFGLRFLDIREDQKETLINYVSRQIKINQNPLRNFRSILRNMFYYKIVKPILFTSRLGRKSMFGYADSGLNFDHIYRNVAKGYTGFGRVVDKILLNLPSAKATRYRKQKIIDMLRREIKNNISLGRKTRIVDLASGPSRYLIEAITEENRDYVEALCLDIDRRNLEFGKKLAGERPVLFKRANVLRLGHYKKLSEKIAWVPNFILCSGLYEYLEDKDVIKSLQDVFASLDKNGLFLFVTQMDSPNKRLIEILGKTRSGKPWVLFYREPDKLKEWMIKAGFKDVYIEIDPWKMYVFYSGRKL